MSYVLHSLKGVGFRFGMTIDKTRKHASIYADIAYFMIMVLFIIECITLTYISLRIIIRHLILHF